MEFAYEFIKSNLKDLSQKQKKTTGSLTLPKNVPTIRCSQVGTIPIFVLILHKNYIGSELIQIKKLSNQLTKKLISQLKVFII